MADAPIHLLQRFLQTARAAEPSDAELLRRFARIREQAAFAEIVRRHGPMVLGTAHRLLGRDPLAEDAFQIAFTALARRAGNVRGESVAGWLHRTTVRAAGRLRRKVVVQSEDLDAVPGEAADPCADVAWREVRQVLDEELNALPKRLRVPLVLCYLEALTRDEAAVRLSWSLRTLERRLGQARATLQARLRRRGVSAVGVAVVATAGGLTLPVPSVLAEAMVRALPLAASFPLRLGVGVAAAALVAAGIAIGIGAKSSTPAADPPAKGPPPVTAAKDPPAVDVPDVPLPPGAVRRFGSLAWRHPAGVSEAVLSADGKTLVTFGTGTLAVWDVPSGRRTYYLREPAFLDTFEPGSVAVAPDGSWVAYLARIDAAVRVVDVATSKVRLTFGPNQPAPGLQPNQFHWRSIWTAPDGKAILLCDKKTLHTFDAATGKETRKVTLPGRVVALSPDGRRCIAHDQENPASAFVCDAETGKELVRLDGDFKDAGKDSWSIRAAFAGDGKRIATLSDCGPEVRLWDAQTGKLAGTFKRAKPVDDWDDIRQASLAVSPDGKTIYAGGFPSNSRVRRWDVASGKELPPLVGARSMVMSLVVTRDTVYSGETDGMIHRWNSATGKARTGAAGHSERAMAALSPDGRTVVTGGFSGQLYVWDASSGRLARTLDLPGEFSGPPFTFRPDGKSFACAVRPGRVFLFDPATWKQTGEIKLSDEKEDIVSGLAFLADGSGIVICHGPDQVERRDIGAGRPRWITRERLVAYAVSADGKYLAISTEKGVSIRSVADVSEVRLIPVRPDPNSNVEFQIRADALAFSPDGALVAATRWDEGDVYVWDVATGREFRRLVGHAAPAHTRIGETSVAFSADGRWLATGHADHTVRIWELATGKEALRLTGHDASVSGVSFARDGKTFLTSAGVEILQWDLRAGSGDAADLDSLWTDLGSNDAARAYKAAGQLSACGDRAAEFLKSKLPPVPPVDADQLAKLVADLDSARFATREAATKALAVLGAAARPALEAGLAKKPSAEGRSRIEDLLARLQNPLAGEDARPMRAVQALQWAGGDAARSVLKAWASGAAGARLTEEAKRALLAID